MTCELAHLDGSYVLGALSPGERLAFERHLPGCAECSRSVRELAGLPGLLAHVDLADLGSAPGPPLPTTLLPSLVREVRRAQRRRTAAVAAVAASVAALAMGALGASGALGGGPAAGPEGGAGSTTSPSTVTTSASGAPMLAVGASPVRADVVVAGVAWGTRLDVTCSYAADGASGVSPGAEYALVVRTLDGGAEQVATWRGLPGRTMRLSAATATRSEEISTVEMRTVDGTVVLRLPR